MWRQVHDEMVTSSRAADLVRRQVQMVVFSNFRSIDELTQSHRPRQLSELAVLTKTVESYCNVNHGLEFYLPVLSFAHCMLVWSGSLAGACIAHVL